ncbi:hypothetical protein Ancab_034318 [Ancistrocladus abbreviatus]
MASSRNQFAQKHGGGGGGAGFGFLRSGFQFNWRNDPTLIQYRECVKTTIARFLAQNSSGNFEQQIAELSACLEDQLFTAAICKEDYLNQESFYDRLQILIKQKWLLSRCGQQKAVLLSTAAPTSGTLNGSLGALSVNALSNNIMFADTGCNVVATGDINEHHFTADVAMNSLSGSETNDKKQDLSVSHVRRKRAFDMTSMSSEMYTSDIHSPGGVFSKVQRVDSGPTFSGTVLQYDSETSFESHRKYQQFTDGELGLVMPSKKKCPSIDVPSKVGEKTVLETVDVVDTLPGAISNASHTSSKVHVSEIQQSLPNLQVGQSSVVEGQSCSRNLVKENNAPVPSPLISTSHGSARFSVQTDLPKVLVNKILWCYIKCKSLPSDVGKSQARFLECLHVKNLFMVGRRGLLKLLKVLFAPAKRSKVETSVTKDSSFHGPSSLVGHSCSPDGPLNIQQFSGSPVSSNSEATELKTEVVANHTQNSASSGGTSKDAIDQPLRSHLEDARTLCEDTTLGQKEMEPGNNNEVKDKFTENSCTVSPGCVSNLSEQPHVVQNEDVMVRTKLEEAEPDVTAEFLLPLTASRTGTKSEKQKVIGVSLTEFFTLEEVKQHLWSLKQKSDQGAAEEISANTISRSSSENTCQLCALDKLIFPPMPIYCSACSARVKNHATYYSTLDENGAQLCFCSTCYNRPRGGNITSFGLSIPKCKLELKKNDVVTEESWVQCDKCEQWQHQICALFNDKRDMGGNAEYICPKCYLEELETGNCMPLPRTAGFGARNLPSTMLSDHIEKRLFMRLQQERQDRAKTAEKNPDEVPEPADLVVRVVSSVDKEVKVKQQFLDIFPDKNYPAEFPYRSKVILLFQRIEGVDVCIFGMYVQEFGSQCSPPNQRCVYISYLDSVKYFRPETKAVTGEALRTFVYHEILIGYLDYCKKRGFATCFIWACPPLKGEDYILYCHPETQKTPKPDKLRHWYQSMLRKATKEQIVVNFTNLYEQFFIPNGECNTKVTAARLPYFDGDYWSSVAESMIKKIEQDCGGDLQKKVQKITRRSLKAMGHVNPSAHDAKDILLMQELGQNISSAKEDFIIVYLQFVCTHCHEVIVSGKRWFCNQCRNYQLCERCHEVQKFEQANTHTTSNGQKHELSQEVVNDVPSNTEDNDAILDNCFLENRHAFLSFCQGNHYQFDTLRRAKHSSTMILYHLHHPSGATSGTSCSLCLTDVAGDPKWKCELCPGFYVCAVCYQRNGVASHTHTLTRYPCPSGSGQSAQNKKADMVRQLLDVLLHASQCQSTASHPCPDQNCLLLRKLFAHARACKVRVSGGCPHCKKTWYLLMTHTRSCTDSNCSVPRCVDLKKSAKGQELQLQTQRTDTIPGD